MKRYIWAILFSMILNPTFSQNKLEFDGQASAITSFSPNNELYGFLGARYIPELSYKIKLDSFKFIDFEASANLSASALFHPFDSINGRANIQPYRAWMRYTNKQFELRVGLQKIDFGAAAILRPIQWFNQIDARDPLQLTNGVYGVLGRYYFMNNANIWLWGLYQNEKTRGFDIIETHKKIPEVGGRIQYPLPRGELALSYHYRVANSTDLLFLPQYEKIPEHRIGLDGKWDLKMGFWFEATYNRKSKNLNQLTHQSLFNIGMDYTFTVGNGLNVIAEHLMTSFDEKAFGFENRAQITALTLAYPFGLFDRMNGVLFYNWVTHDATFLINYEHQFKVITSYLMVYYNPQNQQSLQQNDFINNFAGPGIRLMLVYHH